MNGKPEQIIIEATAKVLMTLRPDDRLRWVHHLFKEMDAIALQTYSQDEFEQLLHELQEILAFRITRKEW
jgi:hypothetical protein